jgi:hypothetical protein
MTPTRRRRYSAGQPSWPPPPWWLSQGLDRPLPVRRGAGGSHVRLVTEADALVATDADPERTAIA